MNNSEIKVLSDKEHVIMRAGMYVGSTSIDNYTVIVDGEVKNLTIVPALFKIINEIIDNSVDEAIRTDFQHANKIDIHINETAVVVSDNGRGLPVSDITSLDGTIIPSCVAAWTMARTGSNFTDDRVTIGANGIGSALTNFLSRKFTGITGNGTNKFIVECENGELIKWTKKEKNSFKGTIVEFEPDFSHFECESITEDLVIALKERLEAIALTFDKIKIRLNGETLSNNIKKYIKDDSKFIIVKNNDYLIALTNSLNDEFIQKSYINGVHTLHGGNHVDWFIGNLCDNLMPLIKKQFKVDISKARIKDCLSLLMVVKNFNNPKFNTQTKERLTSTHGEVSNFFGELNFKKLAKDLINIENIIDPIVSLALAKLDAANKSAMTKASNMAKKMRISAHIKSTKFDDSMLFIAEGESAMNYFITCRNPEKHGGYPLRGKIATTWDMKPNEILANRVFFELLAILNLSPTNYSDISGMTYKYIGIFVDADPDGMGSIMPSLVSFFSKWPEIIKQHRLKIVRSPVYIVTHKDKTQTWFYTKNEFESYNPLATDEVKYVKGLGQMQEDEYRKVINNPKFYVVDFNENWQQDFEVLYGDNSELRKEWMSDK